MPISQLNLLSDLDGEQAHRFELSEIEDATDDFEKIIGKGGFGSVYYGKLNDGTEIAVKVHNTESNQGIREFINEVCICLRLDTSLILTNTGTRILVNCMVRFNDIYEVTFTLVLDLIVTQF